MKNYKAVGSDSTPVGAWKGWAKMKYTYYVIWKGRCTMRRACQRLDESIWCLHMKEKVIYRIVKTTEG